MSKYKTIPFLIIYYSDTDSIYTNIPLDPKNMGTDLGKMKLERVFNKAIFLSPKVYGGITYTDNNHSIEYIKVKGLKKMYIKKRIG